jgi:hypothetical protein
MRLHQLVRIVVLMNLVSVSYASPLPVKEEPPAREIVIEADKVYIPDSEVQKFTL